MRASLLRVLALASLACGTRVVDLEVPGAPAPAPACSDFFREDGARCQLCFDAAGNVSATSCTPAAPMDAGTPPPDTCKVTARGADRCLACAAGNACLKCDVRQSNPGGGACRICVWSDNPMLRCLQCFGDDGSMREDGCDALRKETLIYPMDANQGSGR